MRFVWHGVGRERADVDTNASAVCYDADAWARERLQGPWIAGMRI